MIEPGRGGAYAVLFSEIGISLLVTTLIGAGSGTVMIYRLVTRFLETIK